MLAGRKLKLKKNKSKPKRQRTFTSSELSLIDRPQQHSLSELFRNEAFKRKTPNNPNSHSNPIPLPAKQRSQKQLNCTKKRAKSRSRTRLDRCETYEVIPYKNSFKSDIVFSNEETKREGWEGAQEVAIRVNGKYLADSNHQLKVSIRREYQRKVDAAIKIQKVFRGFLTRRVLQHCMENEQRRLQQRLQQIKSKPVSGTVSEHSSYFAEKENLSGEPNRRRAIDHHGLDSLQDASSSSSDEGAIYRHHEAIYSHEEIGEFGSSEEQDFDQDAFDGHIIFQTNEEYIDSRKSSQQPQPKNKLSRPNALPIAEEDGEQAEVLVKTEKKQDWTKGGIELQEIRDATLKLNEESRVSNKAHFLQVQGEATLKGALEQVEVERLKQEEVGRWEEIIGLVQSQLSRHSDHSQFGSFMQQIMQLSLKNKQSLEIGSPRKPELSLPRLDSKGKLKKLKAERLYLHEDMPKLEQEGMEKQLERPIKHEEEAIIQPIEIATASLPSQECPLESSGQLKRFLLGNAPNDNVQEMLQLREDLVKRREVEEMRKLNMDLENRNISQQAFLDRLQHIQHKYTEQKAYLERAREDIARGHQAALRLAHQAVTDAKKLGYDLPLCRSTGALRAKFPLSNDLLIDELSRSRKEDRIKPLLKRPPKLEPEEPVHISLSSDAESSDLDFNEDELWRYRRAQPDLVLAGEIADLGRNVMISEELLRQQQAEEGMENQLMTTQHVCREIYKIEESSPPRCSPQVEALAEWLATTLLWEAAGELLLRPLFAERLLERKEQARPGAVTDGERLQFLGLLEQNFPEVDVLNGKLNQKICPLPGELLRCMRIDFSQEQDEDSYEEIGKYEFIIGQQVCNLAIQQFRKAVDENAPLRATQVQKLQELGREYNLSEKILRYVGQREKYLCNRRNHTRQLRWEVLNIQIHCIFDAWNEELIALRSQKAGYSGIGLNQLTLSVRDHNSQVPLQETLSLISQGRQRLIRTLSLSSPALVFPLAVEEEQELLQADSRWIFYADEALSYGLELVYLVEEDIFNEVAKELRKRALQF